VLSSGARCGYSARDTLGAQSAGVCRLAKCCRNVLPVSRLLPQQQLVLELLRMSGEIAVLDSADGTILWRTLTECRRFGWISQSEVSPGVHSVALTPQGHRKLEAAV
jgi:hypothetical protein